MLAMFGLTPQDLSLLFAGLGIVFLFLAWWFWPRQYGPGSTADTSGEPVFSGGVVLIALLALGGFVALGYAAYSFVTTFVPAFAG